MLRRDILRAAAAAGAFSAAGVTVAQGTTPPKLIVPFGTGTSTDAVARLLAARLTQLTGRGVIVENVTGAGGVIGMQAIQRAAPDGNTLGVVPGTHAVTAGLSSKLPYDPLADFTPVARIATAPLVIACPARGPASLADLLQAAGRQPNGLSYGSAGIGSSTHLAMELLQANAKVRLLHVPYRASAQLMTDLLEGRLDVAALGQATAQAHVRSGALRALAVTSDQRNEAMPGVPPIREIVAGATVNPWIGLVGPKGLSPQFVAAVASDVSGLMRDPDMRARLSGVGVEPGFVGAAAFWGGVGAEISRYREIARDAGITLDGTTP